MRFVLTLCLTLLTFAGASPHTPSAGDVGLEAELLTYTNAARAEHAAGPLVFNEGLAQAARHHAAEMAALNYFSHTSPEAANATLGQRVARSGSFIGLLGENLALVGPDGVAQATTTGWLESPGHRANLLNPTFTHVGFGTALFPDGRVAVAQVLGYQPAPLTDAGIVSVLRDVPTLQATVSLSSPGEVALFYGDESSRPETLSAGTQTLSVPLAAPPTLPLALQLGLRSDGPAGGFILQDDGWLNPDGFARSGEVTGAYGQLLEVSLQNVLERTLVLRLEFSSPPPEGLAAWQGEAGLPLTVTGAQVEVTLSGAVEKPVYVGEAQADGQYLAVYGFMPELGSTPSVTPVSE